MDKYFIDLPKNSNIVLVCEYGFKAAIIGYTLIKKGFSNVHVLTGGYSSWITSRPDLFKKYSIDCKSRTL
jgi:rhodanese-related sulfurtransferase